MKTTSIAHRIDRNVGTLLGGAYGDALGYPGEFLFKLKATRAATDGVERDLGRSRGVAQISDDTQMTIALTRALVSGGVHYTEKRELTSRIVRRFITWNRSKENNRAPGVTCTRSCNRLGSGMAWQLATDVRSKGNGANMRVAPVGLLHNLSVWDMAGVAQLQAAVTHGHPTALAASDLTALTVRLLKAGYDWVAVLDALETHISASSERYRGDWLGDLWRRADQLPKMRAKTSGEWIARGWDECWDALADLRVAVARGDTRPDPCVVMGMEGRTAEEALVLALYSCLRFEDRPSAALRYAAASRGDSDSIATLAGSFMGARHGAKAWPENWGNRIEHGSELKCLAGQLEEL